MMNIYSRPRFSSPTSVPTAPPWSPNCSTAVGLALMPILCSIDTQCTSLRSPSAPSASTRNFGTANSEMPLTPSGASRRARQHQVDDVVRHVVFAVGDEYLGAEQLICGCAILLRHRPRAHQRQIGPGLRFGQVHGAGPFAVDHFRQVSGFLRIAAGGHQRFDHAIGQQRAQRERQAGGIEHFDARRRHQFRQALPAEFDGMLHSLPAGRAECLERPLEALLVVTSPSCQVLGCRSPS